MKVSQLASFNRQKNPITEQGSMVEVRMLMLTAVLFKPHLSILSDSYVDCSFIQATSVNIE
jgi:hypothetical protein